MCMFGPKSKLITCKYSINNLSPRCLLSLTYLLTTVQAVTITHQHINMSYSSKSKILCADTTVANTPN